MTQNSWQSSKIFLKKLLKGAVLKRDVQFKSNFFFSGLLLFFFDVWRFGPVLILILSSLDYVLVSVDAVLTKTLPLVLLSALSGVLYKLWWATCTVVFLIKPRFSYSWIDDRFVTACVLHKFLYTCMVLKQLQKKTGVFFNFCAFCKRRRVELESIGCRTKPTCVQSKFFTEKLLCTCVPSSLPWLSWGQQFQCSKLPGIPVIKVWCPSEPWSGPLGKSSRLLQIRWLFFTKPKVKSVAAQFQEQLFCWSNKVLTWCNCSFSSAGAPFWSSFSLICTKITGNE